MAGAESYGVFVSYVLGGVSFIECLAECVLTFDCSVSRMQAAARARRAAAGLSPTRQVDLSLR